MKKLETTLLLMIKDGKILLGEKKKGFGKGKLNGPGGKIEPGETPEQGMIRETREEVGVTPTKYKEMGIVEFIEWYKGEEQKVIFYLYVATEYEGELKESEEMKPYWFDLKNIPYDRMFEDDSYWMPVVLAGNDVKAFFKYDKEWNMIEHEVKIIKKKGEKYETFN